MHLRGIRLLVILGVLAPTLSFALEPGVVFEPFDRDKGLSSSSVTAIGQDDQGYLWFATQSGLNRWDGYSMKVWQQEPFNKNTIVNNIVQTMLIEPGGILWLGTYGGLNRFDTKSGEFKTYSHNDSQIDSLSNNVVTKVFRDSSGRLWVGTLDGLNLLNEQTGSFQVFRHVPTDPKTLSSSTVRTIEQDQEGRIWIGTTAGLDLWNDEGNSFLSAQKTFRNFPSNTAVMSVYSGLDPDVLWLGFWDKGLGKANVKTGTLEIFPLNRSKIYHIGKGEEQTLEIATWGDGLIEFDTKNETSFTLKHNPLDETSLSHDVVYSTFWDRSGILWVATNGGGANRYNPRKKQFKQIIPGEMNFPEGKVNVVRADSKQRIWVGTAGGGLVLLNNRGVVQSVFTTSSSAKTLSDDSVNDVFEDSEGRIWIATNQSLHRMSADLSSFERVAFARSEDKIALGEMVNALNATSVAQDFHGDYWIGTAGSGLYRRKNFDTQEVVHRYQKVTGKANSLPGNGVYFVRRDIEGRMWVGTNGGLALYRPESDDFQVWTYDPDNPNGIPSNSVRVFSQDSSDRIWIGFGGGGLALLNVTSGVFQSWGRSQGLTNLNIFGIQEDSRGVLWLSSEDGIFSFQFEKQIFRHYGRQDGLKSIEFSSSFAALPSGEFFVGSLRGLTSFRPGFQTTTSLPPQVVITNVEVLNHSREVTRALNLGWWENTLTFEFSALDFVSVEKNQYAYRLEGFDRDWIYSGSRHFATYTNLNPGNYVFRVKGSNSDDLWAETKTPITVKVDAVPWFSWYAFLVYFSLAGLVVYLYQKVRLGKRLHQKVLELETVKEQLVQANARLDQLSRLDSLTGIPNRRALDNWLEDEWSRSNRQRQSVAVLMIDIDFFKRYNDFYGHLEGDSCLITVAQCLQNSLHRTTDFCARYGGEEFVIVLHDTDREGGLHVAQRILQAVDDLKIPHQMSSAAEHVTVSIGVAARVPTPDTPASEMLQKADQTLYKAKALGRHRVEVSGL